MKTIEEPIEYLIIEHKIFPILTMPRYLYFLSIFTIKMYVAECKWFKMNRFVQVRGFVFCPSLLSYVTNSLLHISKSSFLEKNRSPDIGTPPKPFKLNDAALKETKPCQNSSDNKKR